MTSARDERCLQGFPNPGSKGPEDSMAQHPELLRLLEVEVEAEELAVLAIASSFPTPHVLVEVVSQEDTSIANPTKGSEPVVVCNHTTVFDASVCPMHYGMYGSLADFGFSDERT